MAVQAPSLRADIQGMSQAAVIAIALLAEALLIATAASVVLGWRLRRRSVHAGAGGGGGAREHLQAELAALEAAAPAEDSPLRARQRVLRGELRALDLDDAADRASPLEALYAAPEEDESARLRRLLQREARRVSELLEIRDGLRELKVGYQRLQRLLEKLTDPGLGEAEREQAAEAFRGQESEWAAQLERLLAQLDSATADLDAGTGDGGGGGEEPEAAGGRTDARSLADSQSEALHALRGRLDEGGEADPEALRAELEAIEQRGRELSTCLQVLEDENNYLYQQLCAARAGEAANAEVAAGEAGEPPAPRADPDELEQALAMKDREIEELKQRLYASMESLTGDDGRRGAAED